MTPSPILDALDPEERAHLLDRAVVRSLKPGEHLYLAGERSRRAHLLVSGVMKLAARSALGHETILGIAVAGELLGEVAAVDGLQQPLDAVAATPCITSGMDARVLMDVVSRNPRAALELAGLMTRRARWMCETALERTAGEVPARMAGRLLDLADLLGRPHAGCIALDLPVGQADLGRLAGMSRESACKVLRGFQRAGVLAYQGRRIRILRPDVLEEIRCSGRARDMWSRPA